MAYLIVRQQQGRLPRSATDGLQLIQLEERFSLPGIFSGLPPLTP